MIDFMILIQMKGRHVYPNSDGPGAAYIFLPGSGTAIKMLMRIGEKVGIKMSNWNRKDVRSEADPVPWKQ